MTTSVVITDNVHKLVIKKKNEIFETTGKKRSIKYIVEESIKAGIESVK